MSEHDYTSADTIAAVIFCFVLCGIWGSLIGRWTGGFKRPRLALALAAVPAALGAWSIYRVVVRLILGWVP